MHLARLAEDRHIVLLTVHHIVADGWSLAVLADEVGQAYAALREGRAPDLPELPVQYADHAHRQNLARQGVDRGCQLDRWGTRLAGVPPLDL